MIHSKSVTHSKSVILGGKLVNKNTPTSASVSGDKNTDSKKEDDEQKEKERIVEEEEEENEDESFIENEEEEEEEDYSGGEVDESFYPDDDDEEEEEEESDRRRKKVMKRSVNGRSEILSGLQAEQSEGEEAWEEEEEGDDKSRRSIGQAESELTENEKDFEEGKIGNKDREEERCKNDYSEDESDYDESNSEDEYDSDLDDLTSTRWSYASTNTKKNKEEKGKGRERGSDRGRERGRGRSVSTSLSEVRVSTKEKYVDRAWRDVDGIADKNNNNKSNNNGCNMHSTTNDSVDNNKNSNNNDDMNEINATLSNDAQLEVEHGATLQSISASSAPVKAYQYYTVKELQQLLKERKLTVSGKYHLKYFKFLLSLVIHFCFLVLYYATRCCIKNSCIHFALIVYCKTSSILH